MNAIFLHSTVCVTQRLLSTLCKTFIFQIFYSIQMIANASKPVTNDLNKYGLFDLEELKYQEVLKKF